MTRQWEKFATQVDRDLLAELRALARSEGRQLQVLVDEAITDLIEKRKAEGARPHVMAAYKASHAKYGSVYKKLAK